MHHMGIRLDGMQLFHPDRTEFTDLPQIVPPQIHQHIVLRKLFLIRQQFLPQFPVFLLRPSSRSRAGKGKCVQNPILQFHQCLRRSPRHLYIRTSKVEHIGGWVNGSKNTVCVQQASPEGSRQPVGQNNLENVALPDIVFGGLYHSTISFPVKQRCDLPQQMSGAVLFRLAGPKQFTQFLQFLHRSFVSRLRVIQRHIYN